MTHEEFLDQLHQAISKTEWDDIWAYGRALPQPPKRVFLRSITARNVIRRHSRVLLPSPTRVPLLAICDVCSPPEFAMHWPCPDLRDLAAGYGVFFTEEDESDYR